MYSAYVADPVKNTVRVLAQQYGMSLKRVDAILRLKGMERHWLQVSRCSMTIFFDELQSISLEDIHGYTFFSNSDLTLI